MIDDKISSYTVIESTEIGSAKFVVGENPGNSLTPYGTWQANMKNDPHSYFWGHYFGSKEEAVADYGERITQEARYQQSFNESKPRQNREMERGKQLQTKRDRKER